MTQEHWIRFGCWMFAYAVGHVIYRQGFRAGRKKTWELFRQMGKN